MSYINIEIKARTSRTSAIREYLISHGAEQRGTDWQTDTYFNTRKGRLKLREGKIENNLIYYERGESNGPRQSNFNLMEVKDPEVLKSMLSAASGVKIVVEKKREIYFIGNVKFHLDELARLGNFVEIEASNRYAPLSTEKLREQCNFYMKEFGIQQSDLLQGYYSDMLMTLSEDATESY
jgi:adenylate cyclase class 2